MKSVLQERLVSPETPSLKFIIVEEQPQAFDGRRINVPTEKRDPRPPQGKLMTFGVGRLEVAGHRKATCRFRFTGPDQSGIETVDLDRVGDPNDPAIVAGA